MKIGNTLRSIIMAVIFSTHACADDISTQLRALLTDPPSGFIALQGERESAVWPRWTAKPFLANATCQIIGSDDNATFELRCVINDKAAQTVTDDYYQTTRTTIDQFLATLPYGSNFTRQESASAADNAEGVKTNWAYRSKGLRFDIELTNDKYFGFLRNSLSVRYQKTE